MNQFQEAAKALRSARRFIPPAKRFLVDMHTARYWQAQGRLRRAEHWYRKVLEARVDSVTLVFLGACVEWQGRIKEALALFRRATRCRSDPADEAWYNVGRILLYQGRARDAIKALDRAIAIDPKYRVAIKRRKEALMMLK